MEMDDYIVAGLLVYVFMIPTIGVTLESSFPKLDKFTLYSLALFWPVVIPMMLLRALTKLHVITREEE